MTTNRQPAGTSIGGQWAPGASGEVDDALDDDFLTRDHGVVDDLLDESTDSDALDIISGARTDARGADLSGAKGQLHGYLDHTSEGPGRDEANAALTKLYAAEYQNPTVGIGRLVGDNEACQVADDALARRQKSDEFNAGLTDSVRSIAERHPDAVSASVEIDYSRAVVTGEYTDTLGKTQQLDEASARDLQEVYDSDPISGYKITSEPGVYEKNGRDDYSLDISGVAGGSRQTSTRPFDEADARRVGGGRAESGFMVTSTKDGDEMFHYISGGSVWHDKFPRKDHTA